MDSRAQDIINQISFLSTSSGVVVSVSRLTAATKLNVFGTPIDGTNQTFTTNVIIDSEKIDYTPTLAGGKPKEILKLIANAATFQFGDELQYNNHTYKVDFLQPVPFSGGSVADFVHAAREVD